MSLFSTYRPFHAQQGLACGLRVAAQTAHMSRIVYVQVARHVTIDHVAQCMPWRAVSFILMQVSSSACLSSAALLACICKAQHSHDGHAVSLSLLCRCLPAVVGFTAKHAGLGLRCTDSCIRCISLQLNMWLQAISPWDLKPCFTPS